jgi:nicotinamidase-related amidase
MSLLRLTPSNSMLLVVDVQEKLLAKIPAARQLVRNIAFLVDAAKLLNVTVIATEQYPKGLGETTEELARRLPTDRPAKVTFSCIGAPNLLHTIRSSRRDCVVLVGMETHVCVMQSALDLLAEGFQVFLAADALQARYRMDHETALRRMERAGGIPTTVESIAFEWLGASDHPQFKAISKLIQERMAAIGADPVL